jgi:hypothetical protein
MGNQEEQMSKRNNRYKHRQPKAQPTNNVRSIRAQRSMLDNSMAAGYLGKQFEGKRDYYEKLGYPKDLLFEHFLAKYMREDIAARIIDFPAEETWGDGVTILDGTEDEAVDDSPFTVEFAALSERLRLAHYCERVDKITGVGRYGALLIGVAGDSPLSAPVERLNSAADVLYLRPFAEINADIHSFVNDATDARYGLPALYNVTMMVGATGAGTTTTQVHWSRIIHVAENLLDNEVYGIPRLQRVYNRLDDIMKSVGGSAEATWKLMRKGGIFNLAPDARLSSEEEAAFEEQIDEMDHGLRRYLQLRGIDYQDLGSEVVDPTGNVELILSLISGATGIPKRILIGSERGELASSQDESNWTKRVAKRQRNWADPTVLRPLVDRLIHWGALPAPSTGRYHAKWWPLAETTAIEQMTLAQGYSQVIERMAQPGIEQVINVPKFIKSYVPDLPSDAIVDEAELLDKELGGTDDDTPESVTANMLWNVAHAHRQ